ncbi:hypothetical protein ACW9KT_21455 [Hymenobacter sp. HD11105]|jgi:hypothetical protein
MKKVYLFVCLVLSLQGAALSVSAADEATGVQARATALTRAIANKARLDEGQYLKVKKLNIQMLTEADALKVRLAADPAALDQQMAVVLANYEAALGQVMRSNQLAMYQQSRTSMTALSGTTE